MADHITLMIMALTLMIMALTILVLATMAVVRVPTITTSNRIRITFSVKETFHSTEVEK